MSNLTVVNFDRSQKEEAEQAEQDKRDMLEVLDEMRAQVESGEIVELAAVSMAVDGISQLHVFVKDLPGGVGLFEIGKHMFIAQHCGE